MAQANFGVGRLYAIPAGTAATPVQFATLQDITGDISTAMKELYGANTFPELVARGKGKISLKAKVGRIRGSIFNQVVTPGSTTAVGQKTEVSNEAGTIPAVTSYTITVANSATWVDDLGVIYATGANAGKQFTRVASGPTVGQYSVAAGVYTFAAADASAAVSLSYTYTQAAVGVTTSYSNQAMGAGTTFQLVVGNTYNGNFFGLRFYAVVCSKLSFNMKNEDFTLFDLDFEAFSDATGRVYDEIGSE